MSVIENKYPAKARHDFNLIEDNKNGYSAHFDNNNIARFV